MEPCGTCRCKANLFEGFSFIRYPLLSRFSIRIYRISYVFISVFSENGYEFPFLRCVCIALENGIRCSFAFQCYWGNGSVTFFSSILLVSIFVNSKPLPVDTRRLGNQSCVLAGKLQIKIDQGLVIWQYWTPTNREQTMPTSLKLVKTIGKASLAPLENLT